MEPWGILRIPRYSGNGKIGVHLTGKMIGESPPPSSPTPKSIEEFLPLHHVEYKGTLELICPSRIMAEESRGALKKKKENQYQHMYVFIKVYDYTHENYMYTTHIHIFSSQLRFINTYEWHFKRKSHIVFCCATCRAECHLHVKLYLHGNHYFHGYRQIIKIGRLPKDCPSAIGLMRSGIRSKFSACPAPWNAPSTE